MIAGIADKFKQAHQLKEGDMIALHYGKTTATVVGKVTGNDTTVIILTIDNSEPVRYTESS